jgi:hypothetical protein
MLRVRYPLAVAALAATCVVIPATAAVAQSTGGSNPAQNTVTDATSGNTGSGTNKAGATNSGTSDNGATNSGTSNSGSTHSSSGGGSSTDLTDISGGSSSSSNPLAPLTDAVTQAQSGGSGSQQPDVAGALQTLGTCLSSSQSDPKPLAAGQVCVEDFIKALTNDPRANCLSQNDFTLQFIVDKLKSGQPPSQDDLTKFQTNLTGLLACLNPPPADTSGGGGATADSAPTEQPTSTEAPAAVAVTGTPNFTG